MTWLLPSLTHPAICLFSFGKNSVLTMVVFLALPLEIRNYVYFQIFQGQCLCYSGTRPTNLARCLSVLLLSKQVQHESRLFLSELVIFNIDQRADSLYNFRDNFKLDLTVIKHLRLNAAVCTTMQGRMLMDLPNLASVTSVRGDVFTKVNLNDGMVQDDAVDWLFLNAAEGLLGYIWPSRYAGGPGPSIMKIWEMKRRSFKLFLEFRVCTKGVVVSVAFIHVISH